MEMSARTMTGRESGTVRVLRGIIRWGLYALVFLLPLFFLPWTSDALEFTKQMLVVIAAAVLGLAWLGVVALTRTFEYRRTPVNLIVILYVAVYALATIFSQNRYLSFLGDYGQEKAGLLTLLAFVVLYFVASNVVKTVQQVRCYSFTFVLGGFFVFLYAILQGLGVYLVPLAFAKATSFNTIGTSTAIGMYAVFIVTMASGLLLSSHREKITGSAQSVIMTIINAVTALMGLFIIMVVDFWPVTIALVVASLLMIVAAFYHAKTLRGIGGVAIPVIGLILGVLLFFVSSPIKLGYSPEIMPSLGSSWKMTTQTLRERAIFGSGPGTFIYDYAKFKSPDVNRTGFWDVRFDRSSSRFFTLLATSGLLGGILWALLVVYMFAMSLRRLLKSDETTWHSLIGIFAAWTVVLLSRFLYSSVMTLEFIFWMSAAFVMVDVATDMKKLSFEDSPRASLGTSFLLIVGLVGAGLAGYVEWQRVGADLAYAKAVTINQNKGKIQDVISAMTAAATASPNNDLYLRNLSAALLNKATAEFGAQVNVARQAGEADATYKQRVTDAQQAQAQKGGTTAANALNIAKKATDVVPANVANWSLLASTYQALMGITQGADTWAVTTYQTAIGLEPSNPALYTELGKVYLYQNAQIRQALASITDDKAKAAATKNAGDALNNAIDALQKAISLKGDYAPAHYNLGIAFDRQGKLKDAITRLEAVVRYNPQDVGVGFQLSLLYFRNNQKPAAVKLMESVVRLAPNFANAHWYLGAMYEDRGDYSAALAQVQQVAKTNADNQVVQQKLIDLAKKKPAAGLPAPVAVPSKP